MSALTRWMDARLYAGYSDNWDNQRLRQYLMERLKSDHAILDLGAGRGALMEMNFKGAVKFVAGVDPDPVVHENPFLDEAKTLAVPDAKIPYPDESFNIVFSNNVLEHVNNPGNLFDEIYRILKPGGFFISKTPNKRYYVPAIARLTPHRFHEFINERRGRKRQDTFPTVYRCNTPEEVQKFAAHSGFKVIDLQMWEGRPEYLRLFAITYFMGYLYERLVNSFEAMSKFRCVIVFTLEKPKKS